MRSRICLLLPLSLGIVVSTADPLLLPVASNRPRLQSRARFPAPAEYFRDKSIRSLARGLPVRQTGFGIYGNCYEAFRRNRQFLGLALQDSPHVGHPDRQGDYGSGFAVTERARNIVSDPDHRGQMSLEACKPGIKLLVGCTGFAGKIDSA